MTLPPRAHHRHGTELAAIRLLVDDLRPALDRRDRAAQVAAIGRLLALNAPLGDQWEALASIALKNGEVDQARHAMDRYVDHHGRSPMARYRLAGMLHGAGLVAEAATILHDVLRDVPDRASHSFSRGMIALAMGQAVEARALLEDAVRLNPANGQAWQLLAMTANLAHDAGLGDRIIDAARHIDHRPAAVLAPWCHALGKVHADRGDHDQAFAAYARGARAARALAPFDRAADSRGAADSLAGYSAPVIARLARQQREDTARTVFVTGLPRSGTTLVERILASHDGVIAGGEFNRLPILAHEVGGRHFAAVEGHVAARGTGPAAQLWQHLVAQQFPGSDRVIDKSLHTTRHIGLVASLLPDARLIWLTRDPLDCAWSCFRTYFPTGLGWTCDLADMAHHFALEAGLLARWQDMLGDRLLVVPYEDLVARPEEWTGRLVAHAGLADAPQRHAPHDAPQPVLTASALQVRRPVNRDAVGAAAPYRRHLEAFSTALQAT